MWGGGDTLDSIVAHTLRKREKDFLQGLKPIGFLVLYAGAEASAS